jgi:hypothetical protein
LCSNAFFLDSGGFPYLRESLLDKVLLFNSEGPRHKGRGFPETGKKIVYDDVEDESAGITTVDLKLNYLAPAVSGKLTKTPQGD